MNELTEMRKTKSFWAKPEGTVGMIFAGGGLFLGLVLASGQGLNAVIVFLMIAILLYFLPDNKIKNAFTYLYKSLMRKLTSIIIETDPVSIVLSYIEKMKHNRDLMEEQIGNLNGQIKKLQRAIVENNDQMSRNLTLAKKAKEAGRQELAGLKAMSIGRLKDSNTKLDDLLQKMQGTYEILLKMHEVSGIVIENTEEEVKMQLRERDALIAGYGAFKSAMKILKGDPDQLEDFNTAMEFMADDVDKKVGEMELWIDTSRNFVEGVEMQKSSYIDKGLEMLEQWETKGSPMLLTDGQSGRNSIEISSPTKIKVAGKKTKWD